MDQVSSTEKTPSRAATHSADVAIIGAGPVGLMLANYLGQVGLSVLLIEKLNEIIDYPRAIGIDDEALRTFQAVGLAQTLLPHTTPHHWMRFLTSSGRCFASIEPQIEEYGWPRRNAFIQPLADQVLYQGLSRFPQVSVLFGHTVESFSQDDDGVTIHARDVPGEKVNIRASYLVGSDGGNSFVRRTLDVPFEGRTKPNQWIVVDIKNDPLGNPHVYLCGDPVRPYVSAALPHGVRRFEFMVMPGETEEELSHPDKMAALMRKVVADPDKVDYIRKRVYTHNARLAREFRVGRVLLAGDAAHIMPVWQGQGYNSGMRDAFNLGWKLAMVIKGQADARLLDTYGDERRAHARSMIHLSEVAGDIFAPQGKFAAKFRDVMSYVLGGLPSVKRYFIEMRFKPMPRYEKGMVLGPAPRETEPFLARVLVRSGNSALGRILGLMSEKRESLIGRIVYGWRLPATTAVGRMFMQPKVTTTDGRLVQLDDAIGPRFAVIAWGTDPTYGLDEEARAVWERLDARFIMLKPSVQLTHPQPLPDDLLVLGDPDGQIREWFGNMAHAVVFLRPDRFVAATCGPQQISATTLAIAQKLCLINNQRRAAEGAETDAPRSATAPVE